MLIVEHRLGFIMANAGVDRSNVDPATGSEPVLLLPADPDASAAALCDRLAAHFGKRLGVIITDSWGRAWRRGPCERTALLRVVRRAFAIGQRGLWSRQLLATAVSSVGAAAGGREELQAGRFIRVLAHAEKPLIAAVPGLAVGVGTTMLLHCDLVFVADTAKLSAPFVNLALVPEAASSMLLTARIGHARAFAMFAMGEALSGAEALSLGIANKMLPKHEVIPAAREIPVRPFAP